MAAGAALLACTSPLGTVRHFGRRRIGLGRLGIQWDDGTSPGSSGSDGVRVARYGGGRTTPAPAYPGCAVPPAGVEGYKKPTY